MTDLNPILVFLHGWSLERVMVESSFAAQQIHLGSIYQIPAGLGGALTKSQFSPCGHPGEEVRYSWVTALTGLGCLVHP